MVEKEEEERWVQIVRQKLLVLLLVLVLPKLVVLLMVSLFFVVFCPVVEGFVLILRKSHPKNNQLIWGLFWPQAEEEEGIIISRSG